MKKILVLLLTFGIAGVSPVLLAQAGPDERGERGQRGAGGFGGTQQVEAMSEVLDLSELQVEALTALYAEWQEKLQAADTREARREVMVAMREGVAEAIAKILNEGQQAQWAAHIEERRERMRGAGGQERRQRDGS
jgi:hypothetical protein